MATITIEPDDMLSPERRAEWQDKIDSLLQGNHDLTGWEWGFLRSVKEQLEARGFLFPKQRKELQRLCDEQGIEL